MKIENLGFFAQNKQILDSINLKIQEGEFVSIVGPSGSGKSTLLKIIANIISKTSGNLYFNGKPIEEYNSSDYRKEVSYCFQAPVLFGKTVKDNLSFPYEIRNMEFHKEKSIKYLEEVNLPADYLDKKINTLSGGEKQRIAVIRNVLFQPKVLLLDEITSALDAENRDIIWNWLCNIKANSNMTILMVSHNEDDSKLGDKIISIQDGKLELQEVE
ncbi:MAG: ATP-binding cassette domain-containing protein [Tissierellia bacterium]|nr:ATP-binding cassette domain-containing protein [Tissierellia bacterium]